MSYFVVARMFSIPLGLIVVARHSEHENELEIVLLRHQLRILQRKRPNPPRRVRKVRLRLYKALPMNSTRFLSAIAFAARHVPCNVWRHDLLVSRARLVGPARPHLADPSY